MQYPLLAIEPGGFTQILPSENYWNSLPSGFVAIFKKKQDTLGFYGKDGRTWKLKAIFPSEEVGFMDRLLRPMKRINVSVEFQCVGEYSLDDIRSAMRSAVEADDDILCQHHSRAQILKWLSEAKSISRIFTLYTWITKDFTKQRDKRVRLSH